MGTVEDIDGLRLQAEGFRYRLDKIDERLLSQDARIREIRDWCRGAEAARAQAVQERNAARAAVHAFHDENKSLREDLQEACRLRKVYSDALQVKVAEVRRLQAKRAQVKKRRA